MPDSLKNQGNNAASAMQDGSGMRYVAQKVRLYRAERMQWRPYF